MMGFTRDHMQRRGVSEDLLSAHRASARYGSISAGMAVNGNTVAGIPAFHHAISVAGEAVAQLEGTVWAGDRPLWKRVFDRWQSRLFADRPNPIQNWFQFWYIVSTSIDARGNAFIWKVLDSTGRVHELWALHPDQVVAVGVDLATRGKAFDVEFAREYPLPTNVDRYGRIIVHETEILHILGRGSMGQLAAPSPVTLFRASLGVALAKQQFEASLLENGAGYGLVINFEKGTSREEADRWRDQFDGSNAGVANQGRTKVVAGADVKPITMSASDAQFVESATLSLQDIAHITHTPPWLLAGLAGISSKSTPPGSPENEMQRWLYFYLGPRLTRIEQAINADPDLYLIDGLSFRFDSSDLIRGDMQTEDTIAHQQIQDGRLLVDEWRIRRGLPPLPGGVGMIPQITPVGGAPNQVTPSADSDQDNE